MDHGRECRCRCGCLLARVSVPVEVRFNVGGRGVEIRCRRCKSHAVLVPVATSAPMAHDAEDLPAAE